MPLILASASPRRAELLTSAGFIFEVAAANVDETPAPGEAPEVYALRVAGQKASAAAARRARHGDILAADTVVAAGGAILGKPADKADAARMLRLLSGGVHQVHTAVVVINGVTGDRSEVVTTQVRFVPLGDAEIAWYVASGEPAGKAGAYAIQGRGARFIDWIEGSWSNVVGLPIATVYRLLGGP